MGLLIEARRGTIRGQQIPTEVENFAVDYLDTYVNDFSPAIPSNIIGVNLASETI